MSLRATRQYVEVLGPGDGAVRATRQYLEVLGSVFSIWEASATDTLSLTEEVDTLERIGLGEDTLSLTEAADLDGVYNRNVTDSLSLTEQSEAANLSLNITDSLSLTEQSDGVRVVFGSVLDHLYLYESLSGVRTVPATDTLTLTESADVEQIYWGSDSLTLDETVGLQGIYIRSVTDMLSLSEEAEFAFIKRSSKTETLTLSDTATAQVIHHVGDTLSLTDIATYQAIRRASDDLSLSETAAATIYRYVDAADTLSLSEWSGERFDAGEDTLTLTDEATAGKVQRVRGLDELALTDTGAGQTNKIEVSASDTLTLSESTGTNRFYTLAVGDGLSFTETVGLSGAKREAGATDLLQQVYQEYDPETGEFYDAYIGLQDSATVAVVRGAPQTPSDTLSLSDSARAVRVRANAIVVAATDILSLSDAGHHNPTVGDPADALTLVEEATALVSRLADDTLDLDDEATYKIARVLAVGDALVLSEGVSFYNPMAGIEWLYHPFVGGGPVPVAPTVPVPGITDPFVLLYPPDGSFTDTLVLRSPEFGNRDRLQMNRVSRETRGGTLVVFADPIWPKVQGQVYQFEGLSWDQANGLADFYENHLGVEIGLLDHEHRYWRGVIVNFEEPVVHDGKRGYSAGFEFEGEPATWVQ